MLAGSKNPMSLDMGSVKRGKLIDHPKVKINKIVETELDKYL